MLLGAHSPGLRLPSGAIPASGLIRRGLSELPRGELALHATPVADLGDLAAQPISLVRTGPQASPLLIVEAPVTALFSKGARPIVAASDHAITDHVLRGLFRGRRGARIAVVVVDAHLDVREFMDEEAICSTAPFSRALEVGICQGGCTAVVGLTEDGNSRIVTDWYREAGSNLLLVDDVLRQGPATTAALVLESVLAHADTLYLSVDLDVAGSRSPDQHGLPEDLALAFIAALADSPALVGADIVGSAPPASAPASAAFAARVFLTLAAKLSGR